MSNSTKVMLLAITASGRSAVPATPPQLEHVHERARDAEQCDDERDVHAHLRATQPDRAAHQQNSPEDGGGMSAVQLARPDAR